MPLLKALPVTICDQVIFNLSRLAELLGWSGGYRGVWKGPKEERLVKHKEGKVASFFF